MDSVYCTATSASLQSLYNIDYIMKAKGAECHL